MAPCICRHATSMSVFIWHDRQGDRWFDMTGIRKKPRKSQKSPTLQKSKKNPSKNPRKTEKSQNIPKMRNKISNLGFLLTSDWNLHTPSPAGFQRQQPSDFLYPLACWRNMWTFPDLFWPDASLFPPGPARKKFSWTRYKENSKTFEFLHFLSCFVNCLFCGNSDFFI